MATCWNGSAGSVTAVTVIRSMRLGPAGTDSGCRPGPDSRLTAVPRSVRTETAAMLESTGSTMLAESSCRAGPKSICSHCPTPAVAALDRQLVVSSPSKAEYGCSECTEPLKAFGSEPDEDAWTEAAPSNRA